MPVTDETMAEYRRLADQSHAYLEALAREQDPTRQEELRAKITELDPRLRAAMQALR